ncbi:MAG TPA: LytR C-terminal domain-containing protein [Solirubrobacterales bacterium]
MELIKEIGAFAGLAAFLGLAILALLSFTQGRDIRRLREWAGSAPERDAELKDTTSAAAAERAEELRRLEEARTAEQRAVTEREQRRQRREAGLPEYSRMERIRARFSEPLLLVAGFVAVIVIGGGIAYAVLAGGDGDSGKAAKSKKASAMPPSEIEVTVLNGTAVPGLAAQFGDIVERKGFQLGAVTNSSSSFTDSVVMFERGHAPEARRVAATLGISEVRLMSAEIASVSAGAPVAVVVGEDNASTG